LPRARRGPRNDSVQRVERVKKKVCGLICAWSSRNSACDTRRCISEFLKRSICARTAAVSRLRAPNITKGVSGSEPCCARRPKRMLAIPPEKSQRHRFFPCRCRKAGRSARRPIVRLIPRMSHSSASLRSQPIPAAARLPRSTALRRNERRRALIRPCPHRRD
jgi:hypothetical protein